MTGSMIYVCFFFFFFGLFEKASNQAAERAQVAKKVFPRCEVWVFIQEVKKRVVGSR